VLLRDELREGTHLTDSLRDDLLRAINDRRAERARNDRLLRVLLGPRYAYIAAHAPHLLTDVRAADDHIDNDPDDRHARVDVQDFGFVADEFPHFLALLDDGPLARYTLHWAGLWSPSDDTGYSNESTWIVDLLDLRTGEIVECNDAAACTAAWPDLAAFHRHPYARTNPPPPGEMTLADVRAALMITTRADGWTGLSIDQGSVTGHYSFYLEGYSERAPHAYDFPCVSLRECRLVLEGGADEWEQQWLRSQERLRAWKRLRDVG